MKATALIVEDDPTLATVFANALEAAEYETEIIHDGRVAQERLQEVSPDVIILDLHLPNISGAAIVEQVRMSEHLARTRIIVASADAGLADRVRGQVDLVMDKPVSFHQLRLLSARLRPD